MKLSEIHKVLSESRHLQPALIKTKRGVVIEADHVRWMMTSLGNKFLAVGLKPGVYEFASAYAPTIGVVSKARDFYKPIQYVNSQGQDETGWDSESQCNNCGGFSQQGLAYIAAHGEDTRNLNICQCSNPDWYYDAHRYSIKTRKFQRILTIRQENVVELKLL